MLYIAAFIGLFFVFIVYACLVVGSNKDDNNYN